MSDFWKLVLYHFGRDNVRFKFDIYHVWTLYFMFNYSECFTLG